MVAALWFGLLVPFHPNILTGSVAQDVLDDPLWRLTHAVMFVVGLGGVFAALALIGLHPRRYGPKGTWLLVATIVTSVCTAGTGLVEATTFPVLAERSPDSLAFDPGLFTSPWFVAMTGPWLLFPLCFSAWGWLASSEEGYRNAGRALAAGGVGFFGLGMWFVPVLGPLSCVAFAAALVWWAAILWRVTPAAAGGPSQ